MGQGKASVRDWLGLIAGGKGRKKRTSSSLAKGPSRDRPLAWHLTLFSLSLILPILIVAGALARSYAKAERSRIEDEVLRIAHDAMSATDRKLAGLTAATEVLSLSRHLKDGDIGDFDREARQARDRLGINLVLRDRASNQLVNTRLQPGEPLPQNVDTESDGMAVSTRRPVVSDLYIGAVTRTPLFMINVPVLDGDHIPFFLNLSVEPHTIRDLLLDSHERDGVVVAALDRRGNLIACSNHEPEDGIQPLDPALFPELAGGEGILRDRFVRQQNGAFLVAFSRSEFSGWTFVAMLPKDMASAPLRRSLTGLSSSAAFLLTIAVAFAILFARRIAKPVGALALEAERLGRGELVAAPATRVREFNLVGEALSIAAWKRRETEQAARDSEERLQLAQLAGGVGTWDWDAATGKAVCSDSYCRLYGLDPDSLGHQTHEAWLAQVHPDDRDRAMRQREAAMKSGALESEYRIVRPDGSIRRIVDRGVGVFGVSGELTRFRGASVDVTAARASEERLRELLSELLHASRLSGMGQMAAALAHELSQPIGAVANYVNAARISLRAGAPEGCQRALARLESAAVQTSRAGAILRRMRDFTTLGEADKRMVKVRQVVEDGVALALVGARDPHLRTRLAFHPSDRNPTILIDSVQIQQVIFNLVRNALEATEGQNPREIAVTTRFRGASSIEVAISDSGPGLPQNLEALFMPFLSTKSKGMGLGLSICRAIIEAHGGRLWAQPAPGGGAVFTFSIPMISQEGSRA